MVESTVNRVAAEEQTARSNTNNEPASKAGWFRDGALLFGVTGFAAMLGFGRTLSVAKGNSLDQKSSSTAIAEEARLLQEGQALARRALMRGTTYAVCGVGAFCFLFWKAVGAKDFAEFRLKVGNALPRLSKGQSSGRSDFKSLRDLWEFIIAEDEKKRQHVSPAKELVHGDLQASDKSQDH